MECSVCNTRSEVDSCWKCHALLCEVCGETCERCGEMACPNHVHKTRSGHTLCSQCNEERRARKAARHGGAKGGTGFQSLEGQPQQAAEEEKEEHAALTASANRGAPPWKLSKNTAIAALVFSVILFVFSGLRTLPGSEFQTPWCVVFISVLAAFWAAAGMVSNEPDQMENRPKCLMALGMAVVAVLLAFVSIATDPAREEQAALDLEEQQQNEMTPEERQRQTQEIMNRYNQ